MNIREELRIGNWIQDLSWGEKHGDGGYVQVSSLPTGQLCYWTKKIFSNNPDSGTIHMGIKYDDISPIKMTPEIWYKIDGIEPDSKYSNPGEFFKKFLDRGYTFEMGYFPEGDKRIHLNFFALGCSDFYYDWQLPHIQYLHQVQNLYFGLMGKELIINL